MDDNQTTYSVKMAAGAILLLLGIIALMNFEHRDKLYDLLPIFMGLGLIVFRKPFARSVIASQNQMWGTRFGVQDEKQSARSSTFVGAVMVIWGLAAELEFSFDIAAVQAKEDVLYGLIFMIVGLAMLLAKVDERAIIRYKGQPVMIGIGRFQLPAHQVIALVIGFTSICAGVSMLLGA